MDLNTFLLAIIALTQVAQYGLTKRWVVFDQLRRLPGPRE